MANEDESVWLIYNGEIFNHADVRPALEAAGHRYKSHCDTETVIHSWEQYGAESVSLFRGMFAFVIWDRKQQTLFCVRDRLGIKPFLLFLGWPHLCLRFRDQGAAGTSRDLAAARNRSASRIPELWLQQRRAYAVPRDQAADAWPSPDHPSGQ